MAARKILHLDLDAFFCAVEEKLHPELKGKAFAVGGRPEERGVVASCSYSARQYGIHSAMPMARALSLFPRLIIVSSNHHAYHAASKEVMAILGQRTGLIEQISIDEAFLDVSDLPEPGEEIARGLQAEIYARTALPCSIGVASNKLVAKIATDFGKASHRGAGTYPNAIQVVPVGMEERFLAPLPVDALWGIGPKSAARLKSMGIHTIGDLAALGEKYLVGLFGKNGRDLARHARGIDDRPVVNERETKSISQEVTFERDVDSQADLEDTLWSMAEQVGYRLRQEGLCGSTVRIKLRWPDFSTHTRQLTLDQPTASDELIYRVALELFHHLWQPGRAVRLLGVGVSGLGQPVFQPGLWDAQSEKEHRLQEVIDDLRRRFGERALQRGRDLKNKRPLR